MKKNKMSYVCGTLCCLLAFSSCLGDTATQLTMANQTGVVTTELPSAGKAVYVKGGGVISSEDFQTANVAEGQCILFDYSIDYGAAENADGGASLGYMTATIYDNTITTVDRWPLHSVLSDTSRALPSEQLLSDLQARTAYIRGMLFLFTEIADHPTVQQDSFSLSYNARQAVGSDGVYDLYLRSVKTMAAPDSVRGESMIIPCAFSIGSFVDSVAQANGTDEVSFRVNYAASFGLDSLSVNFDATDVLTVNVNEQE